MADEFADRLDREPPRRVWLAWSAPLLVMGALAWFLSGWHKPPPRFTSYAQISYEDDWIEWPDVRRHFERGSLGQLSAAQRRAITRLLRRTTRYLDPETLDDFIDWNRLVDQVETTGYVRPLGDAQREAVADLAAQLAFVDVMGQRIKLVGLEEIAPDEYIAYVFLWTRERCIPMQWWLSTDGRRWRWYDWRDLGNRRQFSEEIAVAWAYGDDPAWHGSFLGGSWNQPNGPPLILAQDQWNEGRRWSAIEKLHLAASWPVHTFLQDPYSIEVARQWIGMRRYAEALQVLDTIQKPREVPDEALMRARCLAALGRWRDALRFLDSYEQRLGRTPDSCRLRLHIARQTGHTPMLAEVCRAWLNLDPSALEPLLQLAQSEPADAAEKFVAILQSLPSASRHWNDATRLAVWEKRSSTWPALHLAAERLGIRNTWSHALDACMAESRGDLEAARLAWLAARNAAQGKLRLHWNRRLIRVLIESGHWERLTEDPLGPTFALWTLVTTLPPERARLDADKLTRLCRSFQRDHPDSYWGHLIVAESERLLGHWQEAAVAYEAAFAHRDARLNSRARRGWLEVCRQLEGPVVAFHRAISPAEAFAPLGLSLAKAGDWTTLRAFLEEAPFRLDLRSPLLQGWQSYFEAHLRLAEGRTDEAEPLLAEAVRKAAPFAMGGWLIENAVPDLIRVSLDRGTWHGWLADPLVGGRCWWAWVDVLEQLNSTSSPSPLTLEDFFAAYSDIHGDRPELLYHQVRLAAQRKIPARVRDLLWPWPEPTMLQLSPDHEAECRHWLMAALISDGDWAEAEELAVSAQASGDASHLVHYALLRRDLARAMRLWATLPVEQQAASAIAFLWPVVR